MRSFSDSARKKSLLLTPAGPYIEHNYLYQYNCPAVPLLRIFLGTAWAVGTSRTNINGALESHMIEQIKSLSKNFRGDVFSKYIFIAILIAGILSNPFTTNAGRDSGIFLYIGSLILKGKMPYVAAWENKGPLVFYINALGLLTANGSRWGIWFMEFLFLFGAGLTAYTLLQRGMGKWPAVIGTFVWILSFCHWPFASMLPP